MLRHFVNASEERGCFVTTHKDYEEIVLNADVFVYDENRLWFYNSAKIFFFDARKRK